MVDLDDLELELDVAEESGESREAFAAEQEVLSEFAKPRRSIYDMTVLHVKTLDAAMDCFHQYDADGDGLLNLVELGQVFEKLNLSKNDIVTEVLSEMPTPSSGGGIVDLGEFLSILRMAVVSEDPDDDETRFRKAFRSFDKDSNGFLDVKELHHVLNMLDSKYSDEEVGRVFIEMDKDGDGRVDYTEFVKFLSVPKDRKTGSRHSQ
uniref:EF-hand domain-containing protein n=1 Tax=Rhodosorus marinus TaxID=101924 RepID=A0A7S3A2R0_9RHOD|mmetsp:Transcript_42748/g.167034  ORF Transcript_42748/g.167034 Transcript_42748/m.167034 type:complete len:207 (+) Transcript_42748:142-762(+)